MLLIVTVGGSTKPVPVIRNVTEIVLTPLTGETAVMDGTVKAEIGR